MLTGSTPSRNIFWIYRVFTWLSRLLANSERSRILALVLSESWSLFPSDNSIYDRKISKRTKELRDPTYYYHKFHGRKGHQHGRQPNLEMPVTSRENQELHRHWHILISLSSCPVTPSNNHVLQGGGRENCKKFRKGCTVLRGNREMTEKYEYFSTVPRTLVEDCS